METFNDCVRGRVRPEKQAVNYQIQTTLSSTLIAYAMKKVAGVIF